MDLSIRYVNSKCITEKCIYFKECEHISGESRANLIMDTLTKAELNLKIIRNISGKVKGAITIILNKYPKAKYVYCRSHVLNLSIVNAYKITLIQNIMGILLEICIFIKYSAKEGIPLQVFPASCRKYCNFKTIFYQVVMGYPL